MSGPSCCVGSCCGAGSYCCGHPDNVHSHKPVMFSSGKHDHLTADPRPWRCTEGGKGHRLAKRRTAHRNTLGGRPEFDRPLTNAANPLLIALRVSGPFGRQELASWVEMCDRWLAPHTTPPSRFGVTLDHIEHARRVLTRLAALAATTEQEN